jgi:hypothetical protein
MSNSKNKVPAWKPSPENKRKATNLRIISIVLWVFAIALEAFMVYKFWYEKTWKLEVNFVVIAIFSVILILAVVGNLLWRQSNKLDPASEKEPVRFFIQNQLGAIISVLAFLPLLVFILKDKNIDKKTKAILGGVIGIFMFIAIGTGIETNPASIEQYAEETNLVEALTNANIVYWTEYGGKYHLYKDCPYLKNSTKLYSGTVAEAKATKGITELCLYCKKRMMKERGITEEELQSKIAKIKALKEKGLKKVEDSLLE